MKRKGRRRTKAYDGPLGPIPGSNLTIESVVRGSEVDKKTAHWYAVCACTCQREKYIGRLTDVKRLVPTHCGKCATEAREETKALKRSEESSLPFPNEDRLAIIDQFEATIRLESQQERELNETRKQKELARKLLVG